MFLFISPPALHQDLPSEAYLKKERDTWLNVAQNSSPLVRIDSVAQ